MEHPEKEPLLSKDEKYYKHIKNESHFGNPFTCIEPMWRN